MKDVLLDTHVWIWVSVEDKTPLSGKAKRLLRHFMLGAGKLGREEAHFLFNTSGYMDAAVTK